MGKVVFLGLFVHPLLVADFLYSFGGKIEPRLSFVLAAAEAVFLEFIFHLFPPPTKQCICYRALPQNIINLPSPSPLLSTRTSSLLVKVMGGTVGRKHSFGTVWPQFWRFCFACFLENPLPCTVLTRVGAAVMYAIVRGQFLNPISLAQNAQCASMNGDRSGSSLTCRQSQNSHQKGIKGAKEHPTEKKAKELQSGRIKCLYSNDSHPSAPSTHCNSARAHQLPIGTLVRTFPIALDGKGKALSDGIFS